MSTPTGPGAVAPGPGIYGRGNDVITVHQPVRAAFTHRIRCFPGCGTDDRLFSDHLLDRRYCCGARTFDCSVMLRPLPAGPADCSGSICHPPEGDGGTYFFRAVHLPGHSDSLIRTTATLQRYRVNVYTRHDRFSAARGSAYVTCVGWVSRARGPGRSEVPERTEGARLMGTTSPGRGFQVVDRRSAARLSGADMGNDQVLEIATEAIRRSSARLIAADARLAAAQARLTRAQQQLDTARRTAAHTGRPLFHPFRPASGPDSLRG